MLLTSKRVSHKHKTLFTVEGGGGGGGGVGGGGRPAAGGRDMGGVK